MPSCTPAWPASTACARGSKKASTCSRAASASSNSADDIGHPSQARHPVERRLDGGASATDGVLVGGIVEAEALGHVLADVCAQEADLRHLGIQRRLLPLAG